MIGIFHYDSPLGRITMAGDGEALTGLWFVGQRYYGATLPDGCPVWATPLFDRTAQWLDRYFGGHDPGMPPPLRPDGTPFRRTVWELLLRIPYGCTTTYGAIAAEISRMRGEGAECSARAVGNAVGHNPVSILIPCHRVVGSDGNATGYAGGVGRKLRLLALERGERIFAPTDGMDPVPAAETEKNR